ncbi:MAG: alpha/beta hydrolase [Planctomycetota bacterium]
MKNSSTTIIIIFVIFVFFCTPSMAAGQRQVKQTKSGGTYYLIAPPGAGPARPCPLLVAIHGDGYDAKTFQGDWESYASKAGYILALPEKFDHTRGGWGTKDVQCIEETIDEVRKAYGVPARLTVVAGHSSGVTAALNIALSRQEAVSALIGIAGNITPDASKLKNCKKFGVFLMHGTADTIVPIQNGRMARDIFKKAGFDVALKEVQGHQHSTPFPGGAMTEAMKFVATWFRTKARLLDKLGAEGVLEWSEKDAALEELKKGEKPGLVYIYGKKDMKKPMAAFLEYDLFPMEEFKTAIADFIIFRVNIDEDKELAKKLKAKKCTLMLVDKDLKKLKSYDKPPKLKKLLADIEKILKKYEKKK